MLLLAAHVLFKNKDPLTGAGPLMNDPCLPCFCTIVPGTQVEIRILKWRQREFPLDEPFVFQVKPGGQARQLIPFREFDLFRFHLPDEEPLSAGDYGVAATERQGARIAEIPGHLLALLTSWKLMARGTGAALAVFVRHLVHLDPEKSAVILRQGIKEPNVPPRVVGALQVRQIIRPAPVEPGLQVRPFLVHYRHRERFHGYPAPTLIANQDRLVHDAIIILVLVVGSFRAGKFSGAPEGRLVTGYLLYVARFAGEPFMQRLPVALDLLSMTVVAGPLPLHHGVPDVSVRFGALVAVEAAHIFTPVDVRLHPLRVCIVRSEIPGPPSALFRPGMADLAASPSVAALRLRGPVEAVRPRTGVGRILWLRVEVAVEAAHMAGIATALVQGTLLSGKGEGRAGGDPVVIALEPDPAVVRSVFCVAPAYITALFTVSRHSASGEFGKLPGVAAAAGFFHDAEILGEGICALVLVQNQGDTGIHGTLAVLQYPVLDAGHRVPAQLQSHLTLHRFGLELLFPDDLQPAHAAVGLVAFGFPWIAEVTPATTGGHAGLLSDLRGGHGEMGIAQLGHLRLIGVACHAGVGAVRGSRRVRKRQDRKEINGAQ